jgi:hypothetical protein
MNGKKQNKVLPSNATKRWNSNVLCSSTWVLRAVTRQPKEVGREPVFNVQAAGIAETELYGVK